MTDKNELNDILGKKPFFVNQLVGKLNFISGISELEEKIDNGSFYDVPVITNIVLRPKGVELRFMYKFKLSYLAITYEKLSSIAFEDKQQIYNEKNKSVLGRAAVGLIFGPLGAIVGGISGVGTKRIEAKMPDLFFTISHIDERDKESTIVLSAEYKNKKEIDGFISAHFKKFIIRAC